LKNKIIAFSGKAQSGKTETSKILKTIALDDDITVTIVSFASALKKIATDYFGWDGDKEIYYNEDGSIVQDKGRQLLINIGQQFRAIRPTIWVDIAMDKIKKLDQENPENNIFLIDDLRFKNEANVINKIENAAIVRVSRKEGALDIDDISEKDLDDYDFEENLKNNGTLKELEEGVRELYNKIKQ